MKLYPALLLVALAFISCVSSSVQENSKVKNIDSKIREEFEEHRENGDFYGAAQSYIEFMLCCQDGYEETMRRELGSMFEEKVKLFKGEGNNLVLIEHTYSYINLYTRADLRGLGDLEKVSWLLYLERLAMSEGSVHIRASLTDLFLQRDNPALSQIYLDLLSASGKCRSSRASNDSFHLGERIPFSSEAPSV